MLAIGRQSGLGSQEPLGEVFAFTTVRLEQVLSRVAAGGCVKLASDGCWGLGVSFGGQTCWLPTGLQHLQRQWGFTFSGNFLVGDKESGGKSEDTDQSQSREGRTGHSVWTGWSSSFSQSPSERFLFSSQNWSLRMNACYASTEEPRTEGSCVQGQPGMHSEIVSKTKSPH